MKKQERQAPDRKWTGRPEHKSSRDLETRRIHIPADAIRGGMMAAELETIIKTVDYSADNVRVILVDASSSEVEISLPDIDTSTNKCYTIKKTDSSSNSVVITPDGSDTIDGESSISLTLQYQYVTIICEGTAWFIIGGLNMKLDEIMKSVETLLEQNKKLLKAILSVEAYGKDLSNNEEDYS